MATDIAAATVIGATLRARHKGIGDEEIGRKGQSAEGVGQGEPITPDQVDSLFQHWAESAATYISNLKQ